MKQYLKQILSGQSNDNLIEEFISEKESEINDAILNVWKEYSHTPKESKVETKDMFDTSAEAFVQKSNISKEIIETPKNDAMRLQIKDKQITLPNGKVNQEYSFNFDVLQLGIDEVADYEFEGLIDIGLLFDKDSKKISGIPNQAGEHKLLLLIKRSDWQPDKPRIEREITLFVNPDPRSLWNNIPTPEESEYYKPDSCSGFVKVASTKEGGFLGLGKKEVAHKDIVAASQRGRSHAHEGIPRDDDFNIVFDDSSQWYIMAVADGAGSAKFSRKGSQIACDTVVGICEQQIRSQVDINKHIADFNKIPSEENRKKIGDDLYNIIGFAAFEAHKNIEKEAIVKGSPIKDYATTLILSICKKFDFGWFIAAFWVGDGGIGIYDKNSQYLKVLGEPDGGEYAGQTRFLTMKDIIQPSELYRRLRFDIIQDFTAIILMTDGVTDPKFETDANLNQIEKWDELWRDLSNEVDFADDNQDAKNQLMKWLDFWSAGNHDDRTIAILF